MMKHAHAARRTADTLRASELERVLERVYAVAVKRRMRIQASGASEQTREAHEDFGLIARTIADVLPHPMDRD